MIAQGADVIFATSDDMKDGIEAAAAAHPRRADDLVVGRQRLGGRQGYRADLTNLGNIMGTDGVRQDDRRLCGRADVGDRQIAYLGPLINDETRRLVNSAYLGADVLLETRFAESGSRRSRLRGQVDRLLVQHPRLHARPDPGDQRVPGRRLRCGHLGHRHHRGNRTGRPGAGRRGTPCGRCPTTTKTPVPKRPTACLGVPYFNWGPAYLEVAEQVIDGDYAAQFVWLGTRLGRHQQPGHDRDRLVHR